MTRLASIFAYYTIYSVMYLFPFMILGFVVEVLNVNISDIIDRIGAFKQIITILFVGYALVLPGYRAKLASDAYGDRDMQFWEAHTVSGVILKTHLCYLPIIGKLFNNNRDHGE